MKVNGNIEPFESRPESIVLRTVIEGVVKKMVVNEATNKLQLRDTPFQLLRSELGICHREKAEATERSR